MFIIVYSFSMMNINNHTYSLHIVIMYSYIFELYLYVLMLYSCVFMFFNIYISHFKTNMVLCHRHHALPKKANWRSFANAQQHAAALWKACSAGETASRVAKSARGPHIVVGDRHGEISVGRWCGRWNAREALVPAQDAVKRAFDQRCGVHMSWLWNSVERMKVSL